MLFILQVSILSEQIIVFVVSLCGRLPPKLGETAKVYRIELLLARQ